MKMVLRSLICVLFLFTVSTLVQAQKYGHINLGNLLTKMPEVNKGTVTLEQYQKQLFAELEQKVTEWEGRYKALEAKVNEMPPNEVKVQEQKLIEEQQKLRQEEQLITLKVNQKRSEIMGPILQKVQTAVNAVGEEKGYTMIFDTSIPNAMLYVNESDDLTQVILTKLGI